jgi:hypothetical protein
MIAMDQMTWDDRIANYRRVIGRMAFIQVEDGGVYGVWKMGNRWSSKAGYYGGYPGDYLKRIRALFPDKERVLHLFSGKVDLSIMPGDTVDIRPELNPTFVDDAQKLEAVPLEQYDLVLADPPYNVEDAEHYGTSFVKRDKVMRALERLPPGCHIMGLDQVFPRYRKVALRPCRCRGRLCSQWHPPGGWRPRDTFGSRGPRLGASAIQATASHWCQTRKLSPQPQRPFSLGLVKVKPEESAFTS